MGGVQIDIAVVQFVGVGVVQTANDMPAQRVAPDAADILGLSALPATVQRGDRVAARDVVQFVGPVAARTRIAVEHQDGGVGRGGRVFGAQVLGVHPRAADAGKGQIEALGEGRVERVRR